MFSRGNTDKWSQYEILSNSGGGHLYWLWLVWSVFLTEYCAGDKIEKNEMGGACGAYGGGERGAQGSGVEIWRKETTGETQMQMGGKY